MDLSWVLLYFAGTLVTASAHIITAVIGSGVLSLAWANAQLGWVAGPVVLMVFSAITWLMSTLLADCYRSPDPVTGNRNYTYMEVVKANLGKLERKEGKEEFSVFQQVSNKCYKKPMCLSYMGHFNDSRWRGFFQGHPFLNCML